MADMDKSNSYIEKIGKSKSYTIIAYSANILAAIIVIIAIVMFIYGMVFLHTLDSKLIIESLFNGSGSGATLLGVCANILLTGALIVVTGKYALDNNAMLKQTKQEQKIKRIEYRLEKFYYPALSIINNSKNQNYTCIMNGSIVGPNGTRQPGLNDISRYRYLAKDKTREILELFIEGKSKALLKVYKDVDEAAEELEGCIKADIEGYLGELEKPE